MLVDAQRLTRLTCRRAIPEDGLLERLLIAVLTGLRYFARSLVLRQSACCRLNFKMQTVQRRWQETG